ncbi:DUF4157 domain-containing protein [Streptomyces sp. ADMS]|uniref:eCIS core domain-containing protein n=1 Tax=Streptomyces sp. ADMS TaxID=3071415 RepID=UPI0029700535|nr:DUF4157 domain-containing protein [Streptomyces sp. ADMS]MDW4910541.1 DUF4157 domain-containing protein [Streptomyces sp. ADMS]
MIQAKLDVGAIDDPLERAADRMALQVTGASLRRAPAATGNVPVASGGDAGPVVTQAVGRMRGRGRPVPEGIRRRMESATGADLGGVRVHVGHEPDRLNDTLGARAFTVGADVFVRRSEYTPGTATGDALLAHELTHTIQQGAAGPSPSHRDAEHPHTGGPGLGHTADAGAMRAVRTTSTPIAQRAVNPAPADADDIRTELTQGAVATNSTRDLADHLLASTAEVWEYGRDPRTDERAEVGGSAKYLHRRKVEWNQELWDRWAASYKPSALFNAREDRQPAWEHFQQEVEARSVLGENRPPWFLEGPEAGGYGTDHPDWAPENQRFMEEAGNSLRNPDPKDPQQVLGATYARDTMFTNYAQATQDERSPVDTLENDHVAAGRKLQVFGLVDGVQVRWHFDITDTRTEEETRVVVATAVDLAVPEEMNGGVQITEVDGKLYFWGLDATLLYVVTPTHVESDSPEFYMAVVRPGLILGYDRQRNRGVPPVLDETLVATIRGRYENPDAAQSYKSTLGPWRGDRLNMEDLKWGISVASYRRLGGDSIFTEQDHPDRNPNHYSPRIQSPDAVNYWEETWYTNAQRDNPDRFVGGRSNSTFNYMQTASWLYQKGRLTEAECLDLMAFVIADMVVSGEHSMQECMTTVAMVAPYSPPWHEAKTGLRINAPTETLTLWLRLIETRTRRAMLDETRQSLVDQLKRWSWQRDLTLIQMLVVLGKQLYNNAGG